MKIKHSLNSWLRSSSRVPMTGIWNVFRSVSVVIYSFSIEMGFYVSCMVILFVQLFLIGRVILYKLSWLIYTVVLWVDILVLGNWCSWWVDVSIFSICISVLYHFVSLVKFVRQINIPLRSQGVFCNPWKTPHNHSHKLLWTLSHTYLYLPLAMMPYLLL